MKRQAVPFVVALIACAVAAVIALRVFSAKTDDGSQEVEPAKTEAPAVEEKTEEKEEAPIEGTWVITKETQTYRAADEDSDVVTTYELDDQGNVLKVTQESGQSAEAYIVTYTFDEDGYVTSTEDNYQADPVTFTLEKDDQGRLIKSTASSGSSEELTYDEAGNVVQRVMTGSTMGEDMDGNWVVNGTYTATITYDADGFVTGSFYEGDSFYQVIEKSYERNGAGQVISVTNTERSGYDQESMENATANVSTATFEYDDAGNLTRVTEEGDAYSYVTLYEYALIKNPSKAVEATAHLKNV